VFCLFFDKKDPEGKQKKDNLEISLSQINKEKQRNNFEPSYDIIKKENGLYIVIDLPSYSNKNNTNEDDSLYGGTRKIRINKSNNSIVIEGQRILTFYPKEEVGFSDIPVSYNDDDVEIMNRWTGVFTIEIPIIQGYSSKITKESCFFKNGILQIFLDNEGDIVI